MSEVELFNSEYDDFRGEEVVFMDEKELGEFLGAIDRKAVGSVLRLRDEYGAQFFAVGSGEFNHGALIGAEIEGQRFVLKCLKASARDTSCDLRLINEAEAVQEFKNVDGVVGMAHIFEGLVVYDYIDGVALNKFTVDMLETLSMEEVVGVIYKLSLILAEMHERGVMHRDVSDNNVMIGKSGEITLLDFGLVLDTNKYPLDQINFEELGKVGTVGFIAPEILYGDPYDFRVDVFSLGMLAYWLLDSSLFENCVDGDSYALFLSKFVVDKNLRLELEDCPSYLSDILWKAVRIDPGDRYDTMREFSMELGGVLAGLAVARGKRIDEVIGRVRAEF